MDTLNPMAVFAEVVARGSMSAAARTLGMSPSAVSQQVRALERHGGVTLLHRSTRRLSLTDAGARFHEHCAAMVAAAQRARRQLGEAREAPVGELRVAAPVGFARHVAVALGPMLADHAALTLHLAVDDAMTDLIEMRIDLALRFGRLADSSWVAQPLAHFEWGLYAAPAYLRRQPLPAAPAGLVTLQWLAGVGRGQQGLMLELLGPSQQVETLRVQPRIVSNNQLSLQQMAVEGLGVAQLTRADVEDDLRRRSPGGGVAAVGLEADTGLCRDAPARCPARQGAPCDRGLEALSGGRAGGAAGRLSAAACGAP